jgi:hypothetical protein
MEKASTRRVRRLSGREYVNVLSDLLGPALAAEARALLPFEPHVAGFDNQDSALIVSAPFQEVLASVAEKVSAKVLPDSIAPCATAGGSTACLDAFARSFARKAYGRNLSAEEVARLMTVAATGESYATSVRLVVEVVLQSPHTVYASELGPLDAAPSPAKIALTPEELASQVSLLLTAARPDADLLRAAGEGRLATPDDLKREVDRLIRTPRAKEQLRSFIGGWLDMGPVQSAPKNVASFPAFSPAIAAAMQEEIDTFIDQKVAGGDGTFASLLSDTSAYVPAALQPIYGPDLQGGALDPKRRRGILSLPGVLTYHSADHHSGPVERGLLVRRQLLCQDVPAPPDSVLQRIAQNPIDTQDKAKTTRQKYEQHVTEAFCNACHGQFDPIGFGMEEMDGLGRFRTLENGLLVDSSGRLAQTDVDGPFTGVAALAEQLAKSQALRACFARHFYRFAESRPAKESELCLVDGMAKSFEQSGGHFRDLIVRYVTDSGFAFRRDDR